MTKRLRNLLRTMIGIFAFLTAMMIFIMLMNTFYEASPTYRSAGIIFREILFILIAAFPLAVSIIGLRLKNKEDDGEDVPEKHKSILRIFLQGVFTIYIVIPAAIFACLILLVIIRGGQGSVRTGEDGSGVSAIINGIPIFFPGGLINNLGLVLVLSALGFGVAGFVVWLAGKLLPIFKADF